MVQCQTLENIKDAGVRKTSGNSGLCGMYILEKVNSLILGLEFRYLNFTRFS